MKKIALIVLISFAANAFRTRQITFGSVLVGLAILSFIALSFSEVFTGLYIVNDIEYNKITELPDSTQVRILPRAVAGRYLEDSLQKSREKLGPLDFVYINQSLVWTAPRIPDGTILYLTQPVKGIMTANAIFADHGDHDALKRIMKGLEDEKTQWATLRGLRIVLIRKTIENNLGFFSNIKFFILLIIFFLSIFFFNGLCHTRYNLF